MSKVLVTVPISVPISHIHPHIPILSKALGIAIEDLLK